MHAEDSDFSGFSHRKSGSAKAGEKIDLTRKKETICEKAERKAADRAEDLLELLSETPAVSLAGVMAKLDAVPREGQASKDDAEFPWPQIRSALEAIGRIGRQTESSPSSDR